MIGLILVLAWVALALVGGALVGVVRDHESPFTRDFWGD